MDKGTANQSKKRSRMGRGRDGQADGRIHELLSQKRNAQDAIEEGKSRLADAHQGMVELILGNFEDYPGVISINYRKLDSLIHGSNG